MRRISEDGIFRALLIVLLAAALIAVAYVFATAQTPREPPQSVFVSCPEGWTKAQCDAWWKLQRQINDRMEYPFEAIRALGRNVQYGRVAISSAHSMYTVSLPFPYSDTNYVVVLQPMCDSAGVGSGGCSLHNHYHVTTDDTYDATFGIQGYYYVPDRRSTSMFRFYADSANLDKGYVFWLTVGK